MTDAPTILLTCTSCGQSKEVPAASIPKVVINARCRACGHSFPVGGELAPPAETPVSPDFDFEPRLSSPAQSPTAGYSRAPIQPPRSQFVTTLAWVFIVICGFVTFISILQNVMINTIFPTDMMQQAANAPGVEKMPAFFGFMMGNVRLFFASFLVLAVVMLSAAIGLLKRKNWARLLFIGNLSLGIVWNIGGLVLQMFIMDDLPKPVGAPPEFAATFSTMRSVMMTVSVLMAVGFSALCGWLIKKLVSAEVRREFSAEAEVEPGHERV